MSDITIAGATYNDVPSILVPKVGGGFAEYTEGGGGGSLKPFVLRPDAELVQQWTYDKLIVADEGVEIPAYSTSSTSMKRTSTFSLTIAPSTYDYIVRHSSLCIPVYSTDESVKGKEFYSSSSHMYKIVHIPYGTLSAFGEQSKEMTNTVTYTNSMYYYWSGNSIGQSNSQYGAYASFVDPTLSGGTSLTVRSPNLFLRGNTTYFTSAAWDVMTDIRYQYIIELYRSPRGNPNGDGWDAQQNLLHAADCYNNGGKLT